LPSQESCSQDAAIIKVELLALSYFTARFREMLISSIVHRVVQGQIS